MTQLPDSRLPSQRLARQVAQVSPVQPQDSEEYKLQALRHRYLLQIQGGRLHPEHICVNNMERLLDVGCGIGEWVFDIAKRYPQLHVYGVDIDDKALHQAMVRRNTSGLRQLEFRHMDLMQPWKIPNEFLDCIHMGHCGHIVHDRWSPVLRECRRVLKPGGWLNVVEMEFGSLSSPAFMALHYAATQAAARRGSSTNVTGTTVGVASALYGMLLREEFDEVAYTLYMIDFGFMGGSTAQTLLAEILRHASMLKALIVQENLLSRSEFDNLFSQAQVELQAPDLCGWAMLISTYGKRQAV